MSLARAWQAGRGTCLDDLWNALPTPLYVKDDRHRLVYVNDAYCGLVGADRGLLLCCEDPRQLPGSCGQTLHMVDEGTGTLDPEEFCFIDAAGNASALIVQTREFQTAGGRRHVLGIVTDVTESRRTAALLRASEERYRNLFQAVGDGVLVFEQATGRITDVNEAACRLYGSAKSSFLGRTLNSLTAPAQPACPGEPTQAEAGYVWHQRVDGKLFPVDVTIRPFCEGERKSSVAAVRDMSSRLAGERRLRESEELARCLIGTVQVGVILSLLDDEGVLAMNPEAMAMLDLKPENCGRRRAWRFCAGDVDRRHLVESLKAVGTVKDREILCTSADGRQFWALVSAKVTSFRGAAVVVTSLLDITERRRAEAELRIAKVKTDRALSDLHAAKDHLVQAEKMAALGRLVAGLAHEINTPVGIGVTSASYLLRKTEEMVRAAENGEIPPATWRSYLEAAGEAARILVSNMQRTAELVKSFKQVSVDQTTGERRQFNLAGYLDEVLLSLRPQLRAGRHQVVLEAPADLVVDGYPGALARIITNLVMNSVQHGYEAGQPGHISLVVRMLPKDMVELVYSDDGRGIAEEHLHRIFEPFFTTRRHAGGSGLGLHIVFNLVDHALKGEISLLPSDGRGAGFVIRFPRVVPAATAEEVVP